MPAKRVTSDPALAEAIAQFQHEMRHVKEPPRGVGFVVELPDGRSQRFTVLRLAYATHKIRGSKRFIPYYVFRVEGCAVCDAAYETKARRNFIEVTRTCQDHRGQFRIKAAIKAARPQPSKTEYRKPTRRDVIEDLILEVDEKFLDDGEYAVGYVMFVSAVVAALDPPLAGKTDRRAALIKEVLRDADFRSCMASWQEGATFWYCEGEERAEYEMRLDVDSLI